MNEITVGSRVKRKSSKSQRIGTVLRILQESTTEYDREGDIVVHFDGDKEGLTTHFNESEIVFVSE